MVNLAFFDVGIPPVLLHSTPVYSRLLPFGSSKMTEKHLYLKLCPFCGKSPELDENSVICSKCFVRMPAGSPEGAAADWNSRASLDEDVFVVRSP